MSNGGFEFTIGENYASFDGYYDCDFGEYRSANLEHIQGLLCLHIGDDCVHEEYVNIEGRAAIEEWAAKNPAYDGLFKSIEEWSNDADAPSWLVAEHRDELAYEYRMSRGGY